jgi:hypothetical protein
MCFVFFDFSECLMPFESWSSPRFDQDFSKFKTHENEKASLDPS